MSSAAKKLPRGVRPATVRKYLLALNEFERRVRKGHAINAYEFTCEFNLSHNAVNEFCKEGFITLKDKKSNQYAMGWRTVDQTTVRQMLENRNLFYLTTYPDQVKPSAKPKVAANDPVQKSLDLKPVAPKGTGPVSREEYDALMDRVSQLEQLMVRRGIA